MKKKTPYLDFYKECMKTGEITNRNSDWKECGLCYSPVGGELLKEFKPLKDEEYGGGEYNHAFWGSGLPFTSKKNRRLCERGFTPLRQTIVLFMAAMEGEL